jgi:hypothetical protein
MGSEELGVAWHQGNCSVCGTELYLMDNWNGHRVNKSKVCYDCYIKLSTDPVVQSEMMPQKTLLDFT